jgi:glycosyltransferase involved in cell wall biosynthesis
MKVVHVIRDLRVSTGGPVRALKGLAEAQRRAGLDVVIHATDRGGPELVPDDVHIVRTPAWSGTWGFAPGMRRSLAESMAAADIVHLHMVWDYPVWAGARAARALGKPFILRACGQLDRWSMSQSSARKRWYARLLGTHLKHAAAVHFTTQGELESSREFIGDRRAIVIPIGVEPRAFENLPDATAFSRRFPEVAGKRTVLFLGRLHSKKQPDLLVRAFARASAADPRLHLVLAGPADEDYAAKLSALAESEGVRDRVTFTGTLQGAAVVEAYRAAEVFVLPSMQENFGLAIAEAMAAECPVLVSDRVDLAPEIVAADAGVASPADVRSLTNALAALLADPARRARIGANGREMVLRRFTWGPIARDTERIYEEILQSRVH